MAKPTGAPAPTGSCGTLSIRARDGKTGNETAARIHLTGIGGNIVKVPGYPWWHDHFVIPGKATVALPAGHYQYSVERGPEYVPARGTVSIHANSPSGLSVSIARFADMRARGWWPGDLHVHRPIEDIELLMRAEDMYVAPVITWWNAKNDWAAHSIPAQPLVPFDGSRFYRVMAGEDERNGGAFLYFGSAAPWKLPAADREWPSPLSVLAEAKRSTAGLWIDIEKPFWWDAAAAVAQGKCDSVGLANNHMCRDSMYESEAWGKPRDVARLPAPRGNGYWTQEIYYDILNCGLRLPPSAGSASGVLPNPLGYNRVYVHLGGPLSWDAWWDGLRAGRSFVTNGPMLLVRANGELPGHVFTSHEAIEIQLTAEIMTQDSVPYIEVIKNGAIDHIVPFDEWRRSGSLGTLRFDTSGWFIVRAVTDNPRTFRFASTAPYYVEVGRHKRRISHKSALFFLAWVRDRMARIRHDDPMKLKDILAEHRIAEKFWMACAKNANA